MKKTSLIVFGIALIFANSSCVTHSGLITSGQVYPDASKREYVDIAVGYSKVSYFFGIGGFDNDAFLNDAKRKLYFSYPIKNGQSFENLTLDMKTTWFMPYKKMEAIVVADVIERDTTAKINYAQNYSDLLSKNASQSFNFISLNESIKFIDDKVNLNTGKIVKLNKRKATVYYVDSKGVLQIENKRYKALFKYNNLDEIQVKTGFKKGDFVRFYGDNVKGNMVVLVGEIIGLNTQYALVKSNVGTKPIKLEDLKIN